MKCAGTCGGFLDRKNPYMEAAPADRRAVTKTATGKKGVIMPIASAPERSVCIPPMINSRSVIKNMMSPHSG